MWKKVSSEEIVSNRWIGVTKEKVQLPNGEVIEDFYKVRVSNSSAVIALTDEGNIVLKSEYRHCYEKELIEVPSGVFEPGESDPLDVAKRELLEETGYASDDWTYLGETIEDPAKLTNTIHLFLAKSCKKISEQHLDKTEEIDVLVIPLDDAVDMVMDNRICCNSTAHAVLKAKELRNRKMICGCIFMGIS